MTGKRFSILSISMTLLLIACNEKKTVPVRQNKLQAIYVALGGFDRLASVRIDSTLTYYFEDRGWKLPNADKFVPSRVGVYMAKISQSLWDSLNARIDSMNLKGCDSTDMFYEDRQPSVNELEFILYYNHTKVRILATVNENLKGLFDYLYDLHKHLTMKKLFETQVQNLLPAPPPQILVHNLKVTPPSTNH